MNESVASCRTPIGASHPPGVCNIRKKSPYFRTSSSLKMAVRRGFEPRMQLLTAYSLSRGAPSASRPPHHTPLTSASKNLFIAHRRCVAHILLSETYKSNNFSHTFIVCTLHAQLVCKNVKKSVLSTEKRRSDR